MPLRRPLLVLVALASLTSGCRYLRRTAEPSPADSAAAAAQPAAPAAEVAPARPTGPLRDANIAAMLLASNNTDISYARLAPTRAQRDDVKQFAQRMLTDHAGINALVNELLNKLDVAAEDNIASLDMREESASKRDIMRELSGFAFDSVYISNEVSYHQKFLASIDHVMIPNVRNADLRALLTSLRPAVAAHLAHAEQIWANVMAKK